MKRAPRNPAMAIEIKALKDFGPHSGQAAYQNPTQHLSISGRNEPYEDTSNTTSNGGNGRNGRDDGNNNGSDRNVTSQASPPLARNTLGSNNNVHQAPIDQGIFTPQVTNDARSDNQDTDPEFQADKAYVEKLTKLIRSEMQSSSILIGDISYTRPPSTSLVGPDIDIDKGWPRTGSAVAEEAGTPIFSATVGTAPATTARIRIPRHRRWAAHPSSAASSGKTPPNVAGGGSATRSRSRPVEDFSGTTREPERKRPKSNALFRPWKRNSDNMKKLYDRIEKAENELLKQMNDTTMATGDRSLLLIRMREQVHGSMADLIDQDRTRSVTEEVFTKRLSESLSNAVKDVQKYMADIESVPDLLEKELTAADSAINLALGKTSAPKEFGDFVRQSIRTAAKTMVNSELAKKHDFHVEDLVKRIVAEQLAKYTKVVGLFN